ncbi:MAG TPA: patatin-like phospholipase family protein [Candidatus Competibacter sp.]|nr:patatin-like phospholipase family protein [Candidatus Competibacter sp.]
MHENHQNFSASRIGLALSGGGFRAAAFHAGVLQKLADNGWLERVQQISSVSGGSLFTGLVFHASGYRWPTSKQYLEDVLPYIRCLITKKSLQSDALRSLLFNPLNWCFLLSRANVLALSIESLWAISATLDQLPQYPVWSINGTTAENGRRFRFKNGVAGDYEIGYAHVPKFKLAGAMAMSAAFPGGIGPLAFDATAYEWRKKETWDSTQPPEPIKPEYEQLHLYDGGVYDNLGMEPFFDVGKQSIKKTSDENNVCDFMILSDGGAPYPRGAIPSPLHPCRLKRVADIGFDQARAIRVRSFVNFLQNNNASGMYLQIGSDPVKNIERYVTKRSDRSKPKSSIEWLTSDDIRKAVCYPTTLRRMIVEDFNLLVRHGYETTQWNELLLPNSDKNAAA